MSRGSTTRRVSVPALVSLALLAGGCSETSTGPDDGNTGYPDQSTPDHVMEKLVLAHDALDVEAYMECLAEDYVFYLNAGDVDADPSLPEYWTSAEERLIHESLFGDNPDIEDVSFTLNVVSADSLPGQDPDDPADDLWEYDTRIDLRVDSGLPYFATGRVIFLIGRASGRTRTTWEVVQERDLIVPQGWVQEMTLTRIKLAFGGDVENSLYPFRTTPGNVLLKLELAYERMDAEAYLDCLGEDFLFFLNPDDVDEDPEHPLPESWNRAEEETIHGNMFGEDTDVEGVSLAMTLQSETFDEGDPSDPLDDEWTVLEAIDLRADLPPSLMLRATTPSEYVVGVDRDESGYGGARLWEITTWRDLAPWSSREPRSISEHASWTTIKTLFR